MLRARRKNHTDRGRAGAHHGRADHPREPEAAVRTLLRGYQPLVRPSKNDERAFDEHFRTFLDNVNRHLQNYWIMSGISATQLHLINLCNPRIIVIYEIPGTIGQIFGQILKIVDVNCTPFL